MSRAGKLTTIVNKLANILKKDHPVTGSIVIKGKGRKKSQFVVFFDEVIPQGDLPKEFKGYSVAYGANCS